MTSLPAQRGLVGLRSSAKHQPVVRHHANKTVPDTRTLTCRSRMDFRFGWGGQRRASAPRNGAAPEPAICVAAQEPQLNKSLVAVTQCVSWKGCHIDLRGSQALPSRLVERFRSKGLFQQAVTYGIGAGVLVGILRGLDRGVAPGLVTGLAAGLVAGLSFAFRYRSTGRKRVTTDAGIPWLRTLLFSLGFSGVIGAAALVVAAVKTERTTVLAEGIPEIAPVILTCAAAVFAILITTFWWQDRNK